MAKKQKPSPKLHQPVDGCMLFGIRFTYIFLFAMATIIVSFFCLEQFFAIYNIHTDGAA